VVSLGVGVRCDDKGEDNVVMPVLERLGYKVHRGKTNVGLGRTGAAEPKLEATAAVTR
jgi:hypothetical protein